MFNAEQNQNLFGGVMLGYHQNNSFGSIKAGILFGVIIIVSLGAMAFGIVCAPFKKIG